ncbi:CRISPR-associated helicase/endonuclease Cas3 [Vallitalea sediminicola]
MILSHPDKPLKDHLEEVKQLGLEIFIKKHTRWYNDITVKKTLELILYNHDIGKGTKYFQEYIRDPEKYLSSQKPKYKNHATLSAYITYYLVWKLTSDDKLAIIAFYVVKRHHGKLSNLDDGILYDDEDVLNEQLNHFDYDYFELGDEIEEIREQIEYMLSYDFEDELLDILEAVTIDDTLLVDYLFSILISADKGSAIYNSSKTDIQSLMHIKSNEINIDKDIVDKYKAINFRGKPNRINTLRENIYQDAITRLDSIDVNKDKILSINVPTGTGKTLSCINVAIKLREQIGRNNKIIYALPFTSIIEQNYDVFSKLLGENGNKSEVLLKHHFLAEKSYKQSDESLTYDIQEYLIENWDSEIIVTTFVQLLESIFSINNRRLKKLHNMADSIIILDEIQAVPYKYWHIIRKMFIELSRNYNTHIILVTATLPMIFRESHSEIIELVKKKELYFQQLNRITLDKSYIKEGMLLDDFNNLLVEDINKHRDDSFLIVLNTVKSSINIYNHIVDQIDIKDDYYIFYLSTNVIPRERLARINKAKELMKNNKKVIMISTQLIEAGVDIDFDRVYRDFAILDSINQTCGRCNRNGRDKKGIVKLFNLRDDRKALCEYVYDKYLLNLTLKTLNDYEDIIEEKEFYNLSKSYFELLNDGKSDDLSIEIWENISKLLYNDALGQDQFKLINKDFKTVDLFIEVDDEAGKVYQDYSENQKEQNLTIKKEVYNKIKHRLYEYIISVPEKYYDGEVTEGFNIITKEELRNYYNMETGFIRDKTQEDYFF